jgi:hypothetical protein
MIWDKFALYATVFFFSATSHKDAAKNKCLERKAVETEELECKYYDVLAPVEL